MKTVFRRGVVAVALVAALVSAACGGGGGEEESPAPAAVVTNPVDPATAGRIAGTITFAGTPPPAEPINMASDPYCEAQPAATTQTVIVGSEGGLRNAFVYVKEGLGDLAFPIPATPVVLDQEGCHYVPHVLGIQVGQPLEIVSSDDTLHNIHAIPEQNREFNRAQQSAGMTHTHLFSARDVMIPFKCDVHKWMSAYVGVLDHPFYAVTGEDGAFELPGLPPGTYTIEAWHETLGTRTQTITVGEQQTASAAFTFTG